MDAKDNVYPRKETPDNKIDGMVALIMAMKQALLLDVENGYSDRHTFNDEPLIF